MAKTWVEVHDEVSDTDLDGWHLYLQRCTYHYADGQTTEGYQLVYKDERGTLKPYRGLLCPLVFSSGLEGLICRDPEERS